MEEEIKVLVVDDSPMTRRVVSDLLKKNNITVAGEAKDGIEALRNIKKFDPDVIILDIWMPLKNGLEVLKELYWESKPRRDNQKKIPRVVVLSFLVNKDLDLALRCLRLGAVTSVAKPDQGIIHIEKFSEELIKAVREAFAAKPPTLLHHSFSDDEEKNHLSNQSQEISSLIAIGSSTGGPQVLEELITKLPEAFNIPIVVIQHMPAGFTKSFAARLNRLSGVEVREVAAGEKLAPQTVFIAPGGINIAIRSGIFYFDDSSEFRIKPSIDCFFMSAAPQFKEKFVGIILSGMGGDAILGCQAIKENGGRLIVQEPSTCMIDGMVGSILEKKLADEVLIPEKILARMVKMGENKNTNTQYPMSNAMPVV